MAPTSGTPDLFDVEGVAELYGLDPSEFVAARAALVKRLKADGDRTTAAEVAKLRKPSVVAAAVNRVARSRPDDLERLVAASEALADAQRATLLGGDAAELRATATERRRLLAEVVDEATAVAGPGRAGEVSATVEAALADDELSAALRRGTLSDTLSAPAGFGFGLGGDVEDDDEDDDGVVVPMRRARTKARGRGAAAAASSAAEERAAARARRAAEKERRRAAEARLRTARTELDRGEADLRAAEAELGEAQAAVARARERVGEATARCDSLAAAVQAVEAELAALPPA